MNQTLKSIRKRHILFLFILLFIARCFIAIPNRHEAILGVMQTNTSATIEFHYTLPMEGSLKILLKTPTHPKKNSADKNRKSSVGSTTTDNPSYHNYLRNICKQYAKDIYTTEGSRRNRNCNAGLLFGFHRARLYNEETGELAEEWTFPNGAGGTTLLIFNGIPKGGKAKLVLRTQAFDDPDNVLATAIKRSLNAPVHQLKNKTLQVVVETKVWSRRDKPVVRW